MTIEEILDYEVKASWWWIDYVSVNYLQDLIARYFTWKVNRKYRRYVVRLERQRRLVNETLSRIR